MIIKKSSVPIQFFFGPKKRLPLRRLFSLRDGPGWAAENKRELMNNIHRKKRDASRDTAHSAWLMNSVTSSVATFAPSSQTNRPEEIERWAVDDQKSMCHHLVPHSCKNVTENHQWWTTSFYFHCAPRADLFGRGLFLLHGRCYPAVIFFAGPSKCYPELRLRRRARPYFGAFKLVAGGESLNTLRTNMADFFVAAATEQPCDLLLPEKTTNINTGDINTESMQQRRTVTCTRPLLCPFNKNYAASSSLSPGRR